MKFSIISLSFLLAFVQVTKADELIDESKWIVLDGSPNLQHLHEYRGYQRWTNYGPDYASRYVDPQILMISKATMGAERLPKDLRKKTEGYFLTAYNICKNVVLWGPKETAGAISLFDDRMTGRCTVNIRTLTVRNDRDNVRLFPSYAGVEAHVNIKSAKVYDSTALTSMFGSFAGEKSRIVFDQDLSISGGTNFAIFDTNAGHSSILGVRNLMSLDLSGSAYHDHPGTLYGKEAGDHARIWIGRLRVTGAGSFTLCSTGACTHAKITIDHLEIASGSSGFSIFAPGAGSEAKVEIKKLTIAKGGSARLFSGPCLHDVDLVIESHTASKPAMQTFDIQYYDEFVDPPPGYAELPPETPPVGIADRLIPRRLQNVLKKARNI